MIVENRNNQRTVRFGLPGEGIYGYPQGVQVGDMIIVSGQVPDDVEGKLIAHR